MTALLLIGRLCWFVLSRNLMKIPLSLFELQKHHGHRERELIFLGHGNASPWNRITSGSVPRVKHPEPETARRAAAGSTISAILPPSLPLSLSARPSGILVCAFLTSFPRILHTSTQHSKHLPLPPKHLLSTQAGRHLSNIIMLSTTRQALMALAQLHVVQACNWTFFLGCVSFLIL